MPSQFSAGWIKPIAAGGILLLFLILLGSRMGSLPPLGRFFNPFQGFWANAEGGEARDESLMAPGLHQTVTINFDKRRVPRIFAQNPHDLFFAQGYVTARDRLWQMEIQVLAAGGRLAEVLGPGLLEQDRFQRRLGLLRGAEGALVELKKDRESWEAAQAYADGVNAWISSLGPEDYPIEYKLLGYAPRRWTPLNTMLLIKHMQWTLSGSSRDLPMTNTLAKFGPDFVRRFFPMRGSEAPPVIPDWSHAAATAGGSAPAVQPDIFAPSADSVLPALPFPASAPHPVPDIRPDPGNGSNNFVISGSRSRSGRPILANDPHLDLGLPSLWYEVQLSAPGLSAYGVSLPGSPALLIGFNRKIAWGLTNGHDDVFDWYRITFRDSLLEEYSHGGQWKPARKVVEVLEVRGGEAVLDTVVHTHHGPVVLKSQERPRNRNSPALHALRWLALDPSNELAAFLGIMKAENHQEFSAALEDFRCPAQNFAFASTSGDIAMFHHGRFPRKWPGQGRFVLDGSDPGNDWSGWLAIGDAPAARNPAQGWLYSANQKPADSTYPFYLGSEFMDGSRARRLARMLEDEDSATVDRAFAILMDDYNQLASEALPIMLKHISSASLSPRDSAAREDLADWDYRHAASKTAPALFDAWWRLLYKSIWADEFGGDTARYQWPDKERTLRLMAEEPDAEWFDDISTPARETLDFLAARAFRQAVTDLRKPGRQTRALASAGTTAGADAGSGTLLDWAGYRPVRIRHLARIEAFGSAEVATGGCADCVNALKSGHGPSWRMVVSLDGEPKGYGIYPGGQSGNPGSPHYDAFIADWAAGRYYELSLLSNPGADIDGTSHRLQLRGN